MADMIILSECVRACMKNVPLFLITVFVLWMVIWKAFALWISARKGHWIWFIIMLILSTIGILEILYIFVFSKIKLKSKETRAVRRVKRRR